MAGKRLQRLMQLDADVVLRCDDGELPANSFLLRLNSSVLRGALEAARSGSAAGQVEGSVELPLPGTSTADWLAVAPYLYPVAKLTFAFDDQLERALRTAAKYDLVAVLRQAGEFMAEKAASKLVKTAPNLWKWLKLADECGAATPIPMLADLLVQADRPGCASDDNVGGLSGASLRALLKRLVLEQPVPMRCRYCGSG